MPGAEEVLLSSKTQEILNWAIWARRNGLCPCCEAELVCTATGRLDEAEFDGSTRSLGNAVQDSCTAIQQQAAAVK